MTSITDFKSGDIAGFSLAGSLQNDGTIVLMSGEVLTTIPQNIECNGLNYSYETMDKFKMSEKGIFINLNYC